MIIKVKVDLEVKTSSCSGWSGELDKEGKEIMVESWRAKAIMAMTGREYAATKFGNRYKTEAEAIKALKKIIKDTQ